MHSPIFDIGGVIVGPLLRAQAPPFAITNWAVRTFPIDPCQHPALRTYTYSLT
jgi:hypothetical protein